MNALRGARLVACLTVASLGASGCGGERTPAIPTVRATTPPASSVVPGTWSGQWQSDRTPETIGSFTVTFDLAGRTLSGSIRVTGSPCLTRGTITGTLTGDAIRFGVAHRTRTITYRGQVVRAIMSGTYSSCQGNGSWTALKVTS